MPRRKTEDTGRTATPTPPDFPTPALDSTELRMSYRIARGEQGVLTFEPYKSTLLPHWRFKTVPIAEHSSQTLYAAFTHYVSARDFVGADMARKFIQMGMTRAKRYANHKGGRKYDRSAREVERDGGERVELAKSEGHEGREEKLQASEVFKGVWRQCTGDERYLKLKEEFVAEQKAWEREQKKVKKEEEAEVKAEVEDEDGDAG
ncbi:hypothetical protein LTR36_003810 [Oleoguttula mirabilis]|uniref:DUF4385 domain containing protein n=1 Tax=Oleoguttula mirabilis TaxID=1507867 RepID=A0AAV9JI54_9PEZI|nr:hypothetical protein LTR36_003810 [Oleoguttula mirabilis]